MELIIWRCGVDAVIPQVFWAGTGLAILGLMAIALILRRYLLAPMFAIAVAFPPAFGVVASQLLPHGSSFRNPVPGNTGGTLS